MHADGKTRREAAAISFSERGSAARYAKLLTLLPARAASELPRYLAACCHPDQVVLHLETLLQRHRDAAMAAFDEVSPALRACVALFASSPWLSQTLLQNPDLLRLFARQGALETTSWAEDFREQFARLCLRSHDTPLPALLARFKRREYVRIFTRELLGLASLPEITGEISALSDVLIEQALRYCKSELRGRYQGWPQLRSPQGRVVPARFCVLALGKLGGNELNYSSDIDLLYLYDDAEDAGALAITAREFFTSLAQALTSVLSGVSPDGAVFRVDLRLRPQGSSGEMVTGCAQALRYYRSVAQDWELQALLKLRPSAGDAGLGREFVDRVQELIYSNELSLSAIRTAAQSLERIRRGVTRHGGGGLDVKSGPGGLREIEFAVQCLQRVHGGREPWLRSSGTLFALQKLHDKGHIGDAEFRELGTTYALLRSIEHRLQCRHGLQAHRLPEAEHEQLALFASLREGEGGEGAPRNLAELKRIMNSASELCALVLRLGSQEQQGELSTHALRLGAPGSERLAMELAARSAAVAQTLIAPVGDPTLRGLQRFLAAASTVEQRIRHAIENAEWVEAALPVLSQSALATNILACHPEDIVAIFRSCGCDAAASVSDQLRVQARRAVLRTVGRSLLEGSPVWEVLREHTQSLDRILAQALAAAEAPAPQNESGVPGKPVVSLLGNYGRAWDLTHGFAIFAVGRLGTCELDVLSDADLLFVRSPECDPELAGRCAQAVVGMLSGYTRAGSVIEVDTRIRPHGTEGALVPSLRQLAHYFESDAKAWEVLAFSKLRWIAGDRRMEAEVCEGVAALRRRFAGSAQFVPELRVMRKRIADSYGPDSFKGGPGALYDLDFIMGLLEARHGLPAAALQIPERLAALRERELLTEAQSAEMLAAAALFRSLEHAIRVVEGRPRKWIPESDAQRSGVERLLKISESRPSTPTAGVPGTPLDAAVRSQMRRVRAIFDSVLGD